MIPLDANHPGDCADVGTELLALAEDQSQWSQATFGTDAERGPIGALKHLGKEAKEAEDAAETLKLVAGCEEEEQGRRILLTELADCLLLLNDATRRAGFSLLELIRAAQAKMAVNRTRTYPKPTSDVPSEHIKESGT